MDNIYEAIKNQMLKLGVEESQIEPFMRNNKFIISFGEQDVWESRNHNPVLVKREGVMFKYERKDKL